MLAYENYYLHDFVGVRNILKQVCWGMNFFTPAVSNFSLKLRWKCTENASELSYFFKKIPWATMVGSNNKKGGDRRRTTKSGRRGAVVKGVEDISTNLLVKV